ncbi:MAG: ROK family protein [Elusimicrobia bacterium]|nr:ROK family protein [Elusimicrobiota bacterium]
MRKGLRLGVDLGGTQVKMALVNERGRILERIQVSTVKDPRSLVRALAAAAEPWGSRSLLGTGVGVAGNVDPARGLVRFAPNLGWKNLRLADLFRQAGFPSPVVLDNDATAAAWGAHHLEFGGKTRNLIVLTLGTGVGGGLIFDGRLYRGSSGTAGEVGHLTVEAGGEPCPCGHRGCLEAYAGGASLVRWARRAYAKKGRVVDPLNPKILYDRALRGDSVARAAWRRAAGALGTALTGLVNVLNPDTLLLTGGVARAARLFLPEATRVMKKNAFKTPARAVRVLVSKRMEDLGVVGSALLVE